MVRDSTMNSHQHISNQIRDHNVRDFLFCLWNFNVSVDKNLVVLLSGVIWFFKGIVYYLVMFILLTLVLFNYFSIIGIITSKFILTLSNNIVIYY